MSTSDDAHPAGRAVGRRQLRLEPFDPAVRALTRDAVIASRGEPPTVTLQCDRCQRDLARITVVPQGPLFTSWWEAPPRRRRMPSRARPAPAATRELHGVIALLVLPFGFRDDHPDLLVRCTDHGDVVLDRADLASLLRRHRAPVWHVHPTTTRHRYRPLADDWMGDVVEEQARRPLALLRRRRR